MVHPIFGGDDIAAVQVALDRYAGRCSMAQHKLLNSMYAGWDKGPPRDETRHDDFHMIPTVGQRLYNTVPRSTWMYSVYPRGSTPNTDGIPILSIKEFMTKGSRCRLDLNWTKTAFHRQIVTDVPRTETPRSSGRTYHRHQPCLSIDE
jgi:hypothetical protein